MPAGPAPTIITSYFTGHFLLGTQNYMQQVGYICSQEQQKAKIAFDCWAGSFWDTSKEYLWKQVK
jgi:hypothetical protein